MTSGRLESRNKKCRRNFCGKTEKEVEGKHSDGF